MNNKKKALSGIIKLFFSNNAIRIVEFLGSIYLARRIAPEVFGQFAYLTSTIMMFWSFMLIDPPKAIIRKTDDELDFARSSLLVTGSLMLVISLIIIGASFFMPKYGSEMRFILLIMVLAKLPNSLVVSIYAPFLDKHFLYTRKSLISFISRFIGIIGACFLAFMGFKMAALVSKFLLTQLASLFLVLLLSPYIFKPVFNLRHIKDFFHFNLLLGLSVFFRDTLNNLERIVFANVGNMKILGFKNRGFGVSKIGTDFIFSSILPVILPVAAKKKEDKQFMTRFYESVSGSFLRIYFIIAAILYFEGKNIILLLYGERWIDAFIFVRIGLIYFAGQLMLSVANHVHSSAGKVKVLPISQGFRLISFLVIGGVLFYFLDYIGVVWGFAVSSILAAVLSICFLYNQYKFKIWKPFGIPFIAGVSTFVLYLFVEKWIPVFDNLPISVLLNIFFLSVIYISILILIDLRTFTGYYKFLKS